jgi:hypothetical protein
VRNPPDAVGGEAEFAHQLRSGNAEMAKDGFHHKRGDGNLDAAIRSLSCAGESEAPSR